MIELLIHKWKIQNKEEKDKTDKQEENKAKKGKQR